MPGAVITLRDLKTDKVTVDCAHCGRHGEYSVDGLMARHGGDYLLSLFVETASASCPRRKAYAMDTQRCSAYSAELLAMQEAAAIEANSYAKAKSGA